MDARPTDPVEAMKQILVAVDKGSDHFGVLQLERTATQAEVRDQYFRLAKVVHPDLPQFLQKPQLRTDATRAFQAITAAHATLGDVAKRAAYLQAQMASAIQEVEDDAPQTTPGTLEAPVNTEVARIYLHRGRQLLQRRDWSGAQEALELALRKLDGKDLADSKVMLGWAVFNNTRNPEQERIARPRDLWSEVIKTNPESLYHAQAAYHLAVWNKLHGEMKQVMTLLDKCLSLDPKHIEAAREKRLLERRRTTGTFPDMETMNKQQRRTSTTSTPTVPGKVAIEKKPTLLERLFGKRL
jgi:tetratricopeptide (TPR) repeat protein